MIILEPSFGPAIFAFIVSGVFFSAVLFFIQSRKLITTRKWARLASIYGIGLTITLATGAVFFEARTGTLSRLAASMTSLEIVIWGAALIMIVAFAIFARVLATRKNEVTSPKVI